MHVTVYIGDCVTDILRSNDSLQSVDVACEPCLMAVWNIFIVERMDVPL